MENLKKALQAIGATVKCNENISRITVTITIKKPSTSKAPKNGK